jgi:hypothetical protein
MTAAILDVRPAALPGIVPPKGATTNLVRLFALDRRPVGRQPLACRWRRDADGRLACIWEPDGAPAPHR